ncbi:hypothetical protein EZV62_024948 [Acer yangbiense]|uniref:HAT C-terminal dimerisation domain-containing protein n=1 Tax=Acer yangbiense TaxID=1000413 RepID=A0A5C7GWG6_9ROSI|nr:hypothetical protein EZV62_024948 [Acer yangbiense]
MKTVQPLFTVVSRNTIKNDILKIYDYKRSKTMQLLERNDSMIAITTDMWTSNKKKGFMAVSAHFIDESWKLQSRILRFIYVPWPHTSEILAEALMDCVLDWNVDRKISTITVDNCTTNNAMIRILVDKISGGSLLLGGKFFHMRCCAHILNLIVKEGLDVIVGSVEKICDSVVFWAASPKREGKKFEATRQLNIHSGKKLSLDCKTRWNSTYLMLNSALIYKDVFARLKQRESQYNCLPSEKDWKLAKEICDRLELFFEVTEFMITKFEQYWDVIHGIMAVAAILDPRYKMKLIEYYFPIIYGDGAYTKIEKIQKICDDLVAQYRLTSELSEEVHHFPTNPSSFQAREVRLEKVNHMENFDAFVSNATSTASIKSDFDYYLEEPLIPRNEDFDILNWWKANASKYPILHAIARDVLAIPVSTVASESAFIEEDFNHDLQGDRVSLGGHKGRT